MGRVRAPEEHLGGLGDRRTRRRRRRRTRPGIGNIARSLSGRVLHPGLPCPELGNPDAVAVADLHDAALHVHLEGRPRVIRFLRANGEARPLHRDLVLARQDAFEGTLRLSASRRIVMYGRDRSRRRTGRLRGLHASLRGASPPSISTVLPSGKDESGAPRRGAVLAIEDPPREVRSARERERGRVVSGTVSPARRAPGLPPRDLRRDPASAGDGGRGERSHERFLPTSEDLARSLRQRPAPCSACSRSHGALQRPPALCPLEALGEELLPPGPGDASPSPAPTPSASRPPRAEARRCAAG